MTDALSKDDEDVALAGEFALRLLSVEEEQAVRKRLAAEPAFAEIVRGWENRLASIAEDAQDIVPDSTIRREILESVLEKKQRQKFWQRQWSALALTVALTIAILVIGLLAWPKQKHRSPDYFAELVAVDGSFVVLASSFAEGRIVTIRIEKGAPQAGSEFVVWGILPDQTYVPIGAVPESGSLRFELPEALWGTVNETRFTISEEPLGGSIGGIMTGDILASAALEPI